jgi:hypothetical protein
MNMVITIRDLQPIKSDTNNEIWQDLNGQQLDQIKGGNPFALGFFLGVAVGATATAAVGAGAVVVGAAVYYATSGFVPNPNGEGSTGYPILR